MDIDTGAVFARTAMNGPVANNRLPVAPVMRFDPTGRPNDAVRSVRRSSL